MSAALGPSQETVLADGALLRRVIDTFVMAQLRPEVAPVATYGSLTPGVDDDILSEATL